MRVPLPGCIASIMLMQLHVCRSVIKTLGVGPLGPDSKSFIPPALPLPFATTHQAVDGESLAATTRILHCSGPFM